MNFENLLKTLATSKIAKHTEFIRQTIRPTFDIIKNKDIKPFLGCSRFGGLPDLPAGSEWPTYDSIPYRFLGQINFADISLDNDCFPSNGLLSFFVADGEQDGEGKFWLDEGYIYAIYISDLTNLKTMPTPKPPENYVIENPTPTFVLEFIPTVNIPFDEYQVNNWPFDREETDIYDKIRDSLHKSDNYLLGYPTHFSLAYNPTPGPEWISLLTINSDNNLEWCWHDGDYLMVFIEKEKLKKLDFSSLKSDAG